MNSIAPHGPPVQGLPGQLPKGGGQKNDDPSFGDFLAGSPTKGSPSPIDDHSPPPTLDEPDTDDLSGQPLPRPMRWKGGKGPATDAQGPDAAASVPLLPPPLDLRAIVPSVTLSGNWARPIGTPENEGGTAGTGVERSATPAASIGTGDRSNTLPGNLAPTAQPIVGPIVTSRAALTGNLVSSPAQASLVEPDLPGGGEGTTAVIPPDERVNAESGSGASGARAVPIATPEREEILPANSSATDAQQTQADGSENQPSLVFNATMVRSAAADFASANPDTSNALEPAPAPPGPVATGWPVKQPPITTFDLLPKVHQPASPEISSSVRIIATDVAPKLADTGTEPISTAPATEPTATAVPAANDPVELSASSQPDGAKIAVAMMNTRPTADDTKFRNAQVAAIKDITRYGSAGGTSVARDASVVTATAPTTEDAPEASPLPKRGGSVPGGVPAPGRSGNSPAQGHEVFPGLAVAGASDLGATPAQVSSTPAPEPTAARYAAKVETLLQTALSAGEGVRPNGQQQMEMRVRLGGGSEDVMIRLQVANDRMQVTFQTNSPEMRKALEHGWEQFSTSASQASTLALATPRFETSPASFVPPGMQTDAQTFSSQQQNSRRQDAPDASPDETAGFAGFNRSATSTDLPRPSISNPSPSRRWTGWA